MLETIYWKIWYDNGSTFSHKDGLPEKAPVDGILVIVEKKKNKCTTVHFGREYYYWTGENWVSGELASLERWLRKELPKLKYGRWTNDSMFREAMEEVNKWP